MANEKRLIDANALRERMFSYYGCVNEYSSKEYYRGETLMNYEVADLIEDCIDNATTVDAVGVVHGRWLGTHDGWYYSYSCSECGAEALTKEETMHDQVCSNFCPNCGADMRERKDNDL